MNIGFSVGPLPVFENCTITRPQVRAVGCSPIPSYPECNTAMLMGHCCLPNEVGYEAHAPYPRRCLTGWVVPLKPAWTYYVTLVYVSGLEERAGKRMKEGASERADRQASE
ncbi:hypothetical protein DPMN_020239 [Dreissena polymorpha]|uniref:Uncharacterized protein n=1 Tax=Dreissena polymorpha TaxID=45954 RepID=A0A9D4NKR6_DREPO|nr:hypothetical protein DPMN_020239 [Dreissena polymorpha]